MPWELDANLRDEVRKVVSKRLGVARPSTQELIEHVEGALGPKARWYVTAAVDSLSRDDNVSAGLKAFIHDLVSSDGWTKALLGVSDRDHDGHTGIDDLLRQGRVYRDSDQFQEMVQFLAKFRDYSPFNNLLVWTQRPGCRLFATRSKWEKKFKRRVVEDARPMVILAPRTPVLLVYDVDQTDGPPLPAELEEFAQFRGDWDPLWIERMVDNAARHFSIRIAFKELTSTLAGFATVDRRPPDCKMRIVVHSGLDDPSRFGVLCHELAHVLLGHLGNDDDRWWPNRWALDYGSIEIEAESAAFIATWRLGLSGSSARYVSRYMPAGEVPQGVSADHIAKVAGRLQQMATEKLPERSPGTAKRRKGGRGIA
jgi:hypothetical protein